ATWLSFVPAGCWRIVGKANGFTTAFIRNCLSGQWMYSRQRLRLTVPGLAMTKIALLPWKVARCARFPVAKCFWRPDMLLAVSIFLATLVLVIWQPRGLGVGWSASAGAVLALLTGVV